MEIEIEFEDDDVINATEDMEALKQMNPGRHEQIEILYNLIGFRGEPLPGSVFVYGDAATGKTRVIEGVLKLSSAHFALINCVECYTPRLLLEPILNQLLDGEYSNQESEKCDSMMVLVKQIRIAAHRGLLSETACVIVLDNCERLLELGDHYFPAFQKLQELTSISNLCVIFVSQLLPEKFTCDVPYIQIFFPQYNKDDIINILLRENEESCEDEEEDGALFKQFVTFFLDVFYVATRDLNELKHQMLALYPKYTEPVRTGKVEASNTHALYKNIGPLIGASLNNVYLPGADLMGEKENKSNSMLSTKVNRSLDLPYYAKYFLVAGFLASYNSPKDDKRLFVKNHAKKRKRLVQDQKKENASKELLGPKIFTLDRLLAIFYAIMEEKTPLNANLLAQISTLVELRLLVKMGDDLDRPKYKCAVGIETVEAVSRTLDFNVRKYMVC